MTPQEYSARIDELERRIDFDISSAVAAALNAGPGSGKWLTVARVCREIGDLAESLEAEVHHPEPGRD